MYNNIIDIYDRLVDVSTKLHSDFDFDASGFDKCLFALHYALKQYEPVNLHIENVNLKRQLSNIKSKTEYDQQVKTELYKLNGDLINQKNLLQHQLKTANGQILSLKNEKKISHKAGFSPVEIDFEGQKISFSVNTDQINFNQYFQEATNYVYSRRKKRVDLSTIKNWYLEYYRALGFMCVPR